MYGTSATISGSKQEQLLSYRNNRQNFIPTLTATGIKYELCMSHSLGVMAPLYAREGILN